MSGVRWLSQKAHTKEQGERSRRLRSTCTMTRFLDLALVLVACDTRVY
jgi:hypothetical protein